MSTSWIIMMQSSSRMMKIGTFLIILHHPLGEWVNLVIISRISSSTLIKLLAEHFFHSVDSGVFLACNHVTRRPCWWCVGGQYNRIFSPRIYMKIGFSVQRKEMLLFWPPTHHHRRDVTCKPAIAWDLCWACVASQARIQFWTQA